MTRCRIDVKSIIGNIYGNWQIEAPDDAPFDTFGPTRAMVRCLLCQNVYKRGVSQILLAKSLGCKKCGLSSRGKKREERGNLLKLQLTEKVNNSTTYSYGISDEEKLKRQFEKKLLAICFRLTITEMEIINQIGLLANNKTKKILSTTDIIRVLIRFGGKNIDLIDF
jgi:hypothetical protein